MRYNPNWRETRDYRIYSVLYDPRQCKCNLCDKKMYDDMREIFASDIDDI